MERVVRGRLFKVDNKDRKFGSALTYNYISIQDARSQEDRIGTSKDSEGEEFEYTLPREYDLLFTDDEINNARERALRNQEDLLSKSFLSNLTDDF